MTISKNANALGSQTGSHSIAGFYFFFPTVPYQNLKLNNIFVVLLMKTKHFKKFGANQCLCHLIDSLKLIETD